MSRCVFGDCESLVFPRKLLSPHFLSSLLDSQECTEEADFLGFQGLGTGGETERATCVRRIWGAGDLRTSISDVGPRLVASDPRLM